MKTARLILIAVATLYGASAKGQSTDQQYVAPVSSAANIDNGGPIGQSFTPTLPTLDFFRLNLEDNSQNGDGATFQLRIHSGSGLGGPVLGTSNACRNGFQTIRFTCMDYHDIITIEPGKRSGKPCIRGTRMTVADVL